MRRYVTKAESNMDRRRLYELQQELQLLRMRLAMARDRVEELEELLQIERDANDAAVGSEAAALEEACDLAMVLDAALEVADALEELLRRALGPLVVLGAHASLTDDIRAALDAPVVAASRAMRSEIASRTAPMDGPSAWEDDRQKGRE